MEAWGDGGSAEGGRGADVALLTNGWLVGAGGDRVLGRRMEPVMHKDTGSLGSRGNFSSWNPPLLLYSL